ncbi:peptidase domain-containing ABC transporter [Arcicella sp. DC2W]|uniref:Peptidase domain-containing ABC transporter n=1 Tax=Arcicella gelida TaxID=2984195 RepID=A0ABU5S344_9BACT|nr:peptidase domain-containing ABC transporter [Arcicella sp. DC2W]MEA5402899.1 peptidase domain-containing ABC transporter [Arcicella sp. DC2W]
MAKFPSYIQHDEMDCGPTCLKIISKYYGKTIPLAQLRVLSETTRIGSSLLGLAGGAEEIGFRTLGVKISYKQLSEEIPLPCIVHWHKKHYVVVYKITPNKVFVSDPSFGLIEYSPSEFINNWIGNYLSEEIEEGITLALEPSPEFYTNEFEETKTRKLVFLVKYLSPYKKLMFQLFLGLFAGSILQLIFPFLTQSIVDVGIQSQDIHFIYLILVAQLFLFLGTTSIELIRSWILLHVSSRVNLSMLSDFFIKLMKLPIAYFDAKHTGDIMQKINDHHRIESLLTSSSLNILFSFFNVGILGIVLATYSFNIFAIFAIFSIIYIIWTLLFFKKREELDYKRFSQMSQDQNKVIELITGMQDIKLSNAERQKRWSWEYIQARKFRLTLQSTTLSQFQSTGAILIGQLQNILISIVTAKMVIDGNLTIGMMLSVSYIVGQLNAPIQQFTSFLQIFQDAKISLDRINEIYDMKSEDIIDEFTTSPEEINFNQDIVFNKVSYRYPGALNDAIEELSFVIPANKTTAIVGSSGSGKTTMMKMLLKFYPVNEGSISLGNVSLNDIPQHIWRDSCGVVMQEGFIFNDTIANNIAVGENIIDKKKLLYAINIANIQDFIEQLPARYNTKIGSDGVGLSTGQKQRVLIARSVYKNPKLIFFDEATSALDANNEKIIIENLNEFLKNRTSVIIAHRLSTVKNADNIIVLDAGKVVETGNHDILVQKQGYYYNLVKNQLELDSKSTS